MTEANAVLVVDDDQAIVDLLTMALEDQGYTVFTAIGGAAIQKARDHKPRVILLDILMPEMDGVEVSRRLRADPITATIPIVVMSAQDRLDSTSTEMQVNDRLAKPFRLERLYETVARWSSF